MVEQIRRFPPSVLGKITTFMHVSTVCLVLLGNITPLPPLLLSGCFYTSFGFVIISGFDYIYRVSRSIEAARLEREDDASAANTAL
jgi:phosphatidylglycerophosphate synthase